MSCECLKPTPARALHSPKPNSVLTRRGSAAHKFPEKTMSEGSSGDNARDDRGRRHPDQLPDRGRGRPLVLLLHGTYWSRVWQPVLDEIAAAGLRPVAVDFRACDRPIARIASASPRKRICEPCKTTNLPSRDGTRQVASSMVPTRVASASCGVTRSRECVAVTQFKARKANSRSVVGSEREETALIS